MASTHQELFDFRHILPLRSDRRLSSYERAFEGEEQKRSHVRKTLLREMSRWKRVERGASVGPLRDVWEGASKRIGDVAEKLRRLIASGIVLQGDARVFSDSLSLLRVALLEAQAGIEASRELPFIQEKECDIPAPRAFALAARCLGLTGNVCDEQVFASFLGEIQKSVALQMAEVWNLKPFLELVLLEQISCAASEQLLTPARYIADDGRSDQSSAESGLTSLMDNLRKVLDLDWKTFFERTAGPDQILRTDPQSAYERMDFASREAYRTVLAELASHSNFSEPDITRKAIELARACGQASRLSERGRERRTHVGYYLIGPGLATLQRAIGYRPSAFQRLRQGILKWSDYFYLTGIEVITLGVLALLVTSSHARPPAIVVLAVLLLPALDCAVGTVNLLTTRLFPPKRLARLDFSKGIPDDCITVVAVPTLLTSKEQVRAAVEGLEIRFLGNRDPNLHFALLTDLPDSTRQFDENDPLAGFCSTLIDQLNEKYGLQCKGSFFHFHRNRVYNPSEKLWMGWERKRGKLLDFNRFLLGQSDRFPTKTGDLSRIKNVRYVITLDVDTQLPPETAHKLVGTLAHPLNRAVIDHRSNTVVEGYGILQPRVDVSVRSAHRSRLASVLSGDTGLDLYTRAVSDVYQDLFGEGIFTGKGIYEVETFQTVLENRFPCNAVLSHDLIEGIYARTGLVSDVEVVDDYPSHFRAFSRRKHRWVRGDWQIIFGLLPRMQDSFGNIVRNPLNHISRWKIIDNLRRSLTDFTTLLLFVCGWICLPGKAAYWTLAALALILFPTCFQVVISILTAGGAIFTAQFWKNLGSDFVSAHSKILFKLTFLWHQTLVSMDAVIRTLIRMKFTRKRLLQWETAADAEAGTMNSPVDSYLKWSPMLSLAVAGVILAIRPSSLRVALPFLVLWASSHWICKWLSRPRLHQKSSIAAKDRTLLRNSALRTWRFFRQFGTQEENWLIPDIVQERPPLVAHRISTTNLGLLLNARLAARDFGFLTIEEFLESTRRTLETVGRMPKCRGHLYNWYTTDTLEPIEPRFVSTVDNGNLLCSLWTLKHGCSEVLKQPLFQPALWDGILDLTNLLVELSAPCKTPELISAAKDLNQRVCELSGSKLDRFDNVRALEIDVAIFFDTLAKCDASNEIDWWARELLDRVSALNKMVEDFAPWLLTDFSVSHRPRGLSEDSFLENLTLESAPRIYEEISARLHTTTTAPEISSEADRLWEALERSMGFVREMTDEVVALTASIESMAAEMEFSFLYDARKKLLSIGFDGNAGSVSKYHYDLLASEARAAVFVAAVRDAIPQEGWFELGRSYVTYQGEDVLRSWTGTAFEYLMPCLWLRTYPGTLLDRCARAAIRAQQKFVKDKRIPWGISESACNQRNPDGHYRYHAFGVSGLAINRDDCSEDVVIAPYATFLALPFDATGAIRNLHKMRDLGWLSAYGFYEAADFTPRRVADSRGYEVVRSWMAHHQGMSLVATANFLCDSAMQRRFHAEPCVAAHERLLHERYPRVLPREKDDISVPESAPKRIIRLVEHATLQGGLPEFAPKLQ